MKLFTSGSAIIIIGCGMIGGIIASDAFDRNQQVTVIDKDEESFRKLRSSYCGRTLVGDCMLKASLEVAGIKSADIVVVATNDDNINIMISQVALSHYKTKQVLAIVMDLNKKQFCDNLGIQTICPALLSIHKAEEKLFNTEEEV